MTAEAAGEAATVKVAVTQHEPVWFDLAATVEKTCKLIEEAAREGAKLIVFPEVWIPGYPAWIWARPLDPPLATSYIKNSLSYTSPHISAICTAARTAHIAVVLGFSENDNNSLYIAQCTISPQGKILMKRRKLKPTHMERTVFGDGGGESLRNVVEVEGVGRVGALSCWEHALPLVKCSTMGGREQVHVSAWPSVHPSAEGDAVIWSMSSEGIQSLSQTYAIESSSFVLHCTPTMSSAGIAAHRTEGNPLFGRIGGGHSAVYAPDGRRMTAPLPADQEGMLYAELNMEMLVTMRHFIDPFGHYSRPELLWLGVDDRVKGHLRREKEKEMEKEGERDGDEVEGVGADK